MGTNKQLKVKNVKKMLEQKSFKQGTIETKSKIL